MPDTSNLPAVLVADDQAEQLVDLVYMFCDGRRAPKTREAYRRDLTGCGKPRGACDGEEGRHRHDSLAWIPWLYSHGLTVFTARQRHTTIWLADLKEAGRADTTQRRRLAAVSSLYAWLGRQDIPVGNPGNLESSERPQGRRDVSPTAVLTQDQMDKLQAAADRYQSKRGPREPAGRAAALVAVLYATAARVGEVVGMTTDDLRQVRGHPAVTIHGKGGKIRTSPLPPNAYERLHRYLRNRDAAPEVLPATGPGAKQVMPLFATAAGRPMDEPSIYRLLRRLAELAGLPRDVVAHFGAHSMRHSHITRALGIGVPIRDVQRGVGHARSETTEYYDHSRFDESRNAAWRLMAEIRGDLPDDPNDENTEETME